MHLGSPPPLATDNPGVQGVIGYVDGDDGTWRYVSVPALFARLAAETAVELAEQINAIATRPRPDPSEPTELTGTSSDRR